MTEKTCAYARCDKTFRGKRSTKRFCCPAHRLAHFKDMHDPLRGTAAAAARKEAHLDKLRYGQTKKWAIRELSKRGLGFDKADKFPGDADQDPKRPYDVRWIRKSAKPQKTGQGSLPGYRGRVLEHVGDWNDKTVILNWYEDSIRGYLRALEALREPTYPELEVALWHLNMAGHPRANLVGFFEGEVPLVQAVQTMRKLDETLALALGTEPQSAKDWLMGKQPIVKLYKDWSDMSATAATAIMERLDRIERLESMRAETMDHVRETVDKIAARYPDDERIQEKARHLRLVDGLN
jgi:hypothetical protein